MTGVFRWDWICANFGGMRGEEEAGVQLCTKVSAPIRLPHQNVGRRTTQADTELLLSKRRRDQVPSGNLGGI